MFQSTRPRGARLKHRPSPLLQCCFNPRAHVGRDCRFGVGGVVPFQFQSTRPRGARQQTQWHNIVCFWFQSTRPRGARHIPHARSRHRDSFNPRAHVGRDALVIILNVRDIVSIHAPTWGATQVTDDSQISSGFNPRAHVGRDKVGLEAGRDVRVSIHAPTWGATL